MTDENAKADRQIMGFPPLNAEGKARESELKKLVAAAVARHEALSPLEKAIVALEQRRGWVCAELQMNDDASPNGRSAADAERIIREVAPEYVVLDVLRAAQKRIAELEREKEPPA